MDNPSPKCVSVCIHHFCPHLHYFLTVKWLTFQDSARAGPTMRVEHSNCELSAAQWGKSWNTPSSWKRGQSSTRLLQPRTTWPHHRKQQTLTLGVHQTSLCPHREIHACLTHRNLMSPQRNPMSHRHCILYVLHVMSSLPYKRTIKK